MPSQPGYYSWVCFINVQRGGWSGPISFDQIDDYEYGFALDDNIKSWTEFAYYDNKPTNTMTCYFSKRIPLRKSDLTPRSTTFEECTFIETESGSAKEKLLGTARLLLYNSTGNKLFSTLSEHEGRKEIQSRPNWGEWRFRDEYPDHTYLLQVFDERGSRVYARDLRPVGRDIHMHFLINTQGYYVLFQEPW